MGQAIILQGDALRLPLPDESVDLIVTSPPYFALRSYRDGDEHCAGQIGNEPTPQDFLDALWAATAEMVRVLKPSGSIFVNLGDKYAGSGGHNNSQLGGTGKSTLNSPKRQEKIIAIAKERASRRNAPDRYNQNTGGIAAKSLMGLPWRYAIGCVDRLGLILRAEIVWSKPNGLPESVRDRVRRSHEQWFHFTKQGRYFTAIDEIREPYSEKTVWTYTTPYGEGAPKIGTGSSTLRSPKLDSLGKLPGSVWSIPSEPLRVPPELDVDHFAAFPQEWPRRLLLGWSPSGICVTCGEGRRPAVERKAMEVRPSARRLEAMASGNAQRTATSGTMVSPPKARITGYACACPEPTAPARPAVVLDPFGGTGTVAMVARALGRVGISVDLSHDYCRLARWRVFESGHWQKTLDRTYGKQAAPKRRRVALTAPGITELSLFQGDAA